MTTIEEAIATLGTLGCNHTYDMNGGITIFSPFGFYPPDGFITIKMRVHLPHAAGTVRVGGPAVGTVYESDYRYALERVMREHEKAKERAAAG